MLCHATEQFIAVDPCQLGQNRQNGSLMIQGVQRYFPAPIEPSQLWANYNAQADSLMIHFTGKPAPSIWVDVDAYAYIGFAMENDKFVTGLMIEHFSKWLLISGHVQQHLQPA